MTCSLLAIALVHFVATARVVAGEDGVLTHNHDTSCTCDGGVTFLELSYSGPNGVFVTVDDNGDAIFDGMLNNGDHFALFGSDTGGSFDSNNLDLDVNGTVTTIHVSCSVPIYVGATFGPFTVENFASRNNGICLPICQDEGASELPIDLSKKGQGSQCVSSLRPNTLAGVPASVVITARTSINHNAPLDPSASGSTGKVNTQSNNGAGVQTTSCGGSSGISGEGGDRDEELIFTFDEPVRAECIKVGLETIKFDGSGGGSELHPTALAEAGQDATVLQTALVQLSADGSQAIPGQGLTYKWTQIDGPAVALSSDTAPDPSFVAPDVSAPARIDFKLEVTSGETIDTDVVRVTVNPPEDPNTLPQANAGTDLDAESLSPVMLDGTNTSDADGDQLTYQWTQVDGPPVNLIDANTPRPRFLVPDVHARTPLVFRLTVSDGTGESSATTTVFSSSSTDEPVIFISTTMAAGYDITIPTSQILAAFHSTGSDDGYVSFGSLILPDLTVDGFKVRETDDHIYVSLLSLACPCSSNADCNDGDVCNGTETCDPVCGCRAATEPLVCDDGNPCNGVETCDPQAGCVAGTPTPGASCSDGDACNGEEVCDANGDCQSGTPLVCDDGNDCNGTETCDPALGCQSGANLTCPPVDVVFAMDTSGSMQDDGEALCSVIDDVVADLLGLGIVVHHDILAIYPRSNGDLFSCQSPGDSIHALFGDTVPGEPDGCSGDLSANGNLNRDESWGPGTAILANDYPWTPGAIRVIVPISDEGPCTGNPCNNPGSDLSSVQNAIAQAVAHNVIVSPILGSPWSYGDQACVEAMAQMLADGTGGIKVQSQNPASDLSDAIADVILAACTSQSTCDDGDPCTENDSCADGDCTGTPKDCSALNDTCHVGVCNSLTGMCEAVPNAGASCDDGNACTVNDVCGQDGTCGGTPRVCDDGLFCNGAETCDPGSGCQAGTAPSCDDGVSCTTDACDEVNDTCSHTPHNSMCGDGLFCNGVETCDPINGCQAGTPPNCDDGVGCTVDACNEATDSCDHSGSNALCDDGQYCNGVEVCDLLNDCQPGTPPNCNDGVACTVDSCDENTDSCVNATSDALCDDGAWCNGAEACDAVNGCQAGTPPDCHDGVGCTDDSCDEINDVCVNTADNGNCDDGQFCNGAETCDPINGCQAGIAPNCDDGVGCTVDTCDEGNDTCHHTPQDSLCNDGAWCNGAETCDAINDCQAGTAPNCDDGVSCTLDSCNESTDSCDHAPTDSLCDDGAWCDGSETCDAVNGCQAGTAPNCNDGVDCTADTCNESTNSCDHAPTNALCDDGAFCNGAETCDPVNGCQAGAAPNCGDGVACTVDACDEANDTCVNTPDNAACDDGAWCNGAETCDAFNGCQAGTAPSCDDGVSCTDDSCNEANDSCNHVANNAHCNDGAWCNGIETCDAVNDCQAGTVPNCDDGVSCTVDACNESTDACDHAPTNSLCDDGAYCNGVESCDPVHGCQAGTPVNCGDGVACTTDSCDEASDTCVNTPQNSGCDDGLFCNGSETCDPLLGCQAGAAPNCDDGIACTIDSCDEAHNTCVHTPTNSLCSDGAWCNGMETCDAINGCEAGIAPNCDDGVSCTVDSCDEASDVCVNTASDALCDDGAWCDGAETCDAVNDCQAGVAPNCNDGVSCTVDSCDEANDICVNTASDALCDDGAWCDGVETCDAVNDCQAGTPVNCGDGVPCTVDSCDEANDTCVNTPTDSICDDGAWCNGVESCDPVNGCQAGFVPNCDDGVACTTDSCDEVNDVCVNSANDGNCNDGAWCNGVETCDPQGGCQTGTPPSCDDGVVCTTDFCDEANDTCVNDPDDSLCDDTLYCTGIETCDPVNGCQPGGGDPCMNDLICDEMLDACVECVADSDCNDNLYCNGVETCVGNVCQAGTPPDCNDGVSCTADSCDEATDTCVSTPMDSLCNDGAHCNGVETCDPINGCQAGVAPNCDDGVSCTVDSCDEANDTCLHTPTDSLCNDGAFCNGVETCDSINDCQAGAAPSCDDGVACTVDTCNETSDACENTPANSLCDDGAFCNGAETCDALNGCQAGIAPDCNDGVGCTLDSCDEANDVCVNAPNDGNCDDGQFCDGVETCDAVNGCQAGAAPNCDDGVACTTDSCDEANDACVNAPNNSACNDGLFCNGVETCDAVGGCQAGIAPDCDDGVGCTADACNENTDSCDHTPTDSLCDDGAFCNGAETCDAINDCQAGAAPSCNDGVSCTADSCNEFTDTCDHTPSDSLCNDGAFCNGVETCDAVNGCQAGTPPNCNDGVSCTVDSCDEANDTCVNAPSDSACGDGLFCNGTEACDPINGCQGGTAPNCDDGVSCTVDACNETTDACDHSATNSLCDDGAYCNGAETCDAVNGCQAGTAPDCNDGVSCTVDACNEAMDSCDHTGTDSLCDDGAWCNGVETCDALNGCQPGTPPDCNDGVGCTVDSCDEANDVCVNATDDGNCDDGQFCNGVETCDPVNGCQPGAAPNCDDGIPCTIDSCDEITGACVHTPSDAVCSDGAWCNGAETCDAQLGCQAGTAPNCDDGVSCTVDACNEDADSCDHTPTNSLCDDGAFCNGVETCDPINGCQAGAAPNCNDGVDCTVDACNENTDSCDNTPTDSLCDDGAWCNGAETCDAVNDCQAGVAPNCNDGVGCTVDSCDEANDVCVNTPSDTLCDDSQFCNGVEYCDALNGCQAGLEPDCDDGVGCTTDSCDETNDVCVNTPVDSVCNDGLFCNGVETCDPQSDCQAGTPPDCSDDVGCTVDACNEDTDGCDNTPSDALCDDGAWCNGVETCDQVNDCQPGAAVSCDDDVACTVDSCDEANDACVNTPDDSFCSDNNTCNGAETCDAVNGCQAGSPLVCDDGNLCTDDSCDPIDGCVFTPDDTNTCDVDGSLCTIDACVSGVCETENVTCPEPTECATFSCDATTGLCVTNPINEGGACTDDGNVCTLDICSAGACVHPDNDGASCADDGNECTDDLCAKHECVHPNVVDGTGCTSDSIECTMDVCIDGTCDHPAEPEGVACGDSQPAGICDAPDACDGNGNCTTNFLPDTTECRPAAGECDVAEFCTGSSADCPMDELVTNGTLCTADPLFCNGREVCVNGDCVSPGDPCAEGLSCNESANACVDCVNNSQCDDGDPCTTDICAAPGVCNNIDACGACCIGDGTCQRITEAECNAQPLGNFVGAGSNCFGDVNGDGIDESCSATPIPTVSEWGMVVLALLLLIGAKVYFARRRWEVV